MGGEAVDDPQVITYEQLQPGVDLRYTVTAAGVKEDIVLEDAGPGSVFGFEVSGADLLLAQDGGVALGGELGKQLAIPPPSVLTAAGEDHTGPSGVRYLLDGPGRLLVSVDQDWLGSLPKDAFPVVIDPSWVLVSHTGRRVYRNPSGGTNPSYDLVRAGRDSTGRVWRSGVRFNQWAPYVGQGYRMYSARAILSSQAQGTRTLHVYDEGVAGPSSFATVGDAGLIETLTVNSWDDFLSGVVDVTDLFRDAFDNGDSARWLGIRGTETGITAMDYGGYIEMYLLQPVPESHVTNIANNQVLSTATPTLHAQPVTPAEGYTVAYDFQITTSPSPGSGLVLSSGLTTATSWQVPAGALAEGVTYWAWVLTDYSLTSGSHPLPTVPLSAAGRRFNVDLGLGEGGPSPTDEVGSVPAQASSPSEGAPGPSVPGSKLTVNLVNGNLSLGVGTRASQTLSGPLALGFTYNSLSVDSHGLRAEFYNDTNTNGEIDSNDVLVGQRVDPTVSFDWGGYAKPVAAQDPSAALARWSGFVTLPFDGNVQLGAISSDGLRVSVGGTQRLNRWASHEPEAVPVFGSSFAVTAGTTLPISVEWRNTSGKGVARVFVREANYPDEIYPLSANWLTHRPAQLPAGWMLNAAAGSGRWVGLHDLGTSVSVFSSDGSAHEFVASGDGAYTAPLTAPNDLLTAVAEGGFVLEDAAGSTYTFRADGALESIVTATDDRNPAGLAYRYTGAPARLTTITDPVSSRAVQLSYGGDTACPSAPPAASGLLCHIGFWDGKATTLTYDTAGRFVRLTNPGGIIHDFAYDANGRLTDIRDPLAVDAVAAGVRADDGTERTQVAYYSDGKPYIVAQPSPSVGAARPGRVYGYDQVARTGSVYVLGFTPTVGYAQQVTYDTRNRITKTTGADGLSVAYTWDPLDRLVGSTDTAGLRSTTVYDHASRPAVTYGPAPTASFKPDGLPAAGAAVPVAARTYDGGIDALGATYWSNPDHAGGPELHDTGLGTGGDLDWDWATTPPVTPSPQGWSARYDGFIDVASAGSHQFQVSTKGNASVWIDSTLAASFDGTEPSTGWATATGDPVDLTAGKHRIRLDVADRSGQAGLRVLHRVSGGGSFSVVAGSALEPNYGLVTSEVDPDGLVTASEYSDPAAGVGPHHGLVIATIADPGGLDLRTSMTYETPGPGSYMRRTARTLPAGTTWNTDNYGGTSGPITAVCGVTAGTAQGGMAKRTTGPDPDGPGPHLAQVEEFVYDAIGRRVGRRAGDTSTIAGAGWQCSNYDARGRLSSQTWPAHGAAPARTVAYSYAVGGNPLVNTVSDNTWAAKTISATVDQLGRTVSYTDIFGQITTTTFDQAGRQTGTDNVFDADQHYDPATGRAGKLVINGYDTATPGYDSYGRLESVSYFNNTASVHVYDEFGRYSQTGVIDQNGWTGDLLTRSLAGRVKDQTVGSGGSFIDANPGGDNYNYDGAGRLTQASMLGAAYNYSFDSATACPAPDAGDNTNRTTAVVTGAGAGTTNSCYDHADRLVSTNTIPGSEITYDDHGNTTRLGAETFRFDAADRHVATITDTHITRHRRDPLDRIAERSDTQRITHVATTTATGAASVSITRPAGTQPGDLLVASIAVTGVVPAAVSSSGWTVAAQRVNGTGRTAVLWRYATSSDPTAWSFTSSLVLNTTGAISTYRAAAGSTPVVKTATGASLATASHPLPQVTTNTDAAQVVSAIGFAGTVNAAAPASTHQRANVASAASLLVVDRELIDPGSSGKPVVTTAQTAASSASVTVAISAVTNTDRYLHAGHSDTSQFTSDTSGTITGWTVPMAGNAIYTYSALGGFTVNHFNMHGDVMSITNSAGTRVWEGLSGPYGETIASNPANTAIDGASYAWHGLDERITDRGGIVHMGARPYAPTHGRFLSVDPIEGGCAYNYTYVHGDPVNTSDTSGTNWLSDRLTGVAGAIGGFVCSDNMFNRVFTSTFSLLPPTENTRQKRAAYAAGTNAFIWGNVSTYLLQDLTQAELKSVAIRLSKLSGASVAFELKALGSLAKIGKGMNWVTVAATAYDALRRLRC